MQYKITWRGPHEAMENASTFFSELFHSPVHAIGLRKIDETTDSNTTDWSIEIYIDQLPDIPSLEKQLIAFDRNWATIATGTVEEIPQNIDWVAQSLDGLGVVKAGRFTLYGIHDADKINLADTGDIPIRIDANMAFGTGHHPTTQGCLELLDRLAGMPARSILDLGCGSAVLAIAAAKLWDREVLASDIDADSVTIARENARLNGVNQQISFVEATGFDHGDIFDAAPFDFVFANILAGPLIALAPGMKDHVSRSGRVMLAGLMAEQEKSVTDAYEHQGFRRINKLDHATWPVLLFAKP